MSKYKREIDAQCCNQWMKGIRTINGQYPDDNRDLTIQAGTGVTITPVTAGIEISAALPSPPVPSPMTFRGTLGTGGTIQTLPAATSANIGDVYVALESGTVPVTYETGDMVISNGITWVVIPSGDDPVDWSQILNTPDTIAGYGITDAVDLNTAQTIDGIKTFNSNPKGANPASGATDNSLVTANWVSQTGDSAPNNLVHKTGNESIAGRKKVVTSVSDATSINGVYRAVVNMGNAITSGTVTVVGKIYERSGMSLFRFAYNTSHTISSPERIILGSPAAEIGIAVINGTEYLVIGNAGGNNIATVIDVYIHKGSSLYTPIPMNAFTVNAADFIQVVFS